MSEGYLDSTSRAYGSSSARFVELVGVAIGNDFETAEDQAALAAFAVRIPDDGLAIDAGCGPGRVARFLADQGIRNVRGVDIAPGMIDEARSAHRDIRFDVAPLTSMPVEDDSVAAVIYWYSIITTPPQFLDGIWTELNRVLTAEGRALVSFQAGTGETEVRENAYGTAIDLALYRHDPDHVAQTLTDAGFTIESLTQRPPQLEHEQTTQAILTCHR